MAKKPSSAGATLLANGWEYAGKCGPCNGKMKKWLNPNRKGEELRTASKTGFFSHYVGVHNVKTGQLSNLKEYLESL